MDLKNQRKSLEFSSELPQTYGRCAFVDTSAALFSMLVHCSLGDGRIEHWAGMCAGLDSEDVTLRKMSERSI